MSHRGGTDPENMSSIGVGVQSCLRQGRPHLSYKSFSSEDLLVFKLKQWTRGIASDCNECQESLYRSSLRASFSQIYCDTLPVLVRLIGCLDGNGDSRGIVVRIYSNI